MCIINRQQHEWHIWIWNIKWPEMLQKNIESFQINWIDFFFFFILGGNSRLAARMSIYIYWIFGASVNDPSSHITRRKKGPIEYRKRIQKNSQVAKVNSGNHFDFCSVQFSARKWTQYIRIICKVFIENKCKIER